jgi:hypothetical protein
MKRCLLFLLLAFPFPLTSLAATSPPSQTALLAKIERSTQQIRKLTEVRSVKGVFLTDKAFDTALTQGEVRDTPEAEVQLNQREYELLGFVKKTQDLHRIFFHDLNSQVGGFYDYHRHVLYVRNHANTLFGPRRDLIAHEYTHALQDQHYNLARLLPDQMPLKYRNSDAVFAHRCLIEGDAVVTELLFVYRTYTQSELANFTKLQSQPQNGPPIPKGIERMFYFPYEDGVTFTTKLFTSSGIKGIDAAYARIPTSTYEIMYPSAYAAHWKPASVSLHSVQGFDDWQQSDDDVFGAFGYRLLLLQYLDKATAARVIPAYRGDRYVFLQKGEQNLMLLKSVWKDGNGARAARSALISALRRHFHAARVSGGAAATVAGSDGAAYLAVKGARLTFALAPTGALAQQLGTAPTS